MLLRLPSLIDTTAKDEIFQSHLLPGASLVLAAHGCCLLLSAVQGSRGSARVLCIEAMSDKAIAPRW